jgi:iron complex transport system substrate-binding protein
LALGFELLTTLLLAGSLQAQVVAPSKQAASAARVTDETGRVVAVPQTVRRIVSLAPNLTETVFALGLGDRVVGDTDYCDYPPEAKSKEHVGGPVSPNLEKIAVLRPDLVLATRAINRPATVQSLEQLGIAVYATDPRTVEQVLASIEQLGRLLGAAGRGRAVVADLRRRLAELADRLSGSKPKSVFFVVWQEPLISVGRDTFLADALRRAGAQMALEVTQDWPNVNLEELVRLQPEYLVFFSDQSEQTQRMINGLRDRPGWRQLEALRHGRVIVLSEAVSRPAPRLIDAIEQLARALHPERFPAAEATAGRPDAHAAPSAPRPGTQGTL